MERELLLLGFLRRENMHGYKLNEFIERDMAACTDLNTHSISRPPSASWPRRAFAFGTAFLRRSMCC